MWARLTLTTMKLLRLLFDSCILNWECPRGTKLVFAFKIGKEQMGTNYLGSKRSAVRIQSSAIIYIERLLSTVIERMKIKGKEVGNGPICKKNKLPGQCRFILMMMLAHCLSQIRHKNLATLYNCREEKACSLKSVKLVMIRSFCYCCKIWTVCHKF